MPVLLPFVSTRCPTYLGALMAGGNIWTEDEKDFLAQCVRESRTIDETYTGYVDRFGEKRSSVSVAKGRQLRDVQDRVHRTSNPERVARFLSGEHTPGIKEGPTFPDWTPPEDVDWREWFDSFQTTQDLYKRIDPSQEILTVDLSKSKTPVAVAFAADFHMGGGYTDHRAIRSTIEYILATPGLYVATIGDLIEGFIPGEKSAETVEQMVGSLKGQLGALKSVIAELAKAKKILCMTWGDHDAKWFEKLVGLNIVKSQFHDRVPYFNGRGLIRLLVGKQEYWLQVNHALPGNSYLNPNHAQRKAALTLFPADVTASGHTHKPAFQMMHHFDQLREVGINLGGRSWLVQVGTFKTGPDGYTVRTWTRGIMGVPTGVFYHDRHEVDMLTSPAKATALVRGTV